MIKQLFRSTSLIVAIAATTLLSCNKSSDDSSSTDGLMLADISESNYPIDNDEWSIATTSASAADFQGLLAALKHISYNYPNREISLNFPNLNYMPSGAFMLDGSESKADLHSLVSVSSSSVSEVGAYAFYGNESLLEANFPAATMVGEYAFADCSSLASVNLDKVSVMGSRAFNSCLALAELSLPNLYLVGDYCFNYCIALNEVDLSSLEIASSGLFNSCTGLVEIELPIATELCNDTFASCRSLTKVSAPSAIHIGKSFTYCVALESMELATITGAIVSSLDQPFFGVDTTNITLEVGSNNSRYVFEDKYFIYDTNNIFEFKLVSLK